MYKRTISLRTIVFATCILVSNALAASSVGAQVVPAQTFTSAGVDSSPQQSANCNTGVLQVSGSGSWTVVPQGSNDNGVTYVTIPTIGGGSIAGSGTFSGSVAGYAASFFRFNVTAVSGSVTVTKSCTSQILPVLPSGLGGDTTFPTTISASGTQLGTPPTGTKGVEIDVPPGASVSEYIATTQAASAAAAVNVAHTYANPASSTTALAVQFNLANANGTTTPQQVYITNATSGTATTYTSGIPTYRWI